MSVLRHAYGGLSTGTMQFLCLKTDDVFQELQESLDQAAVKPMATLTIPTRGFGTWLVGTEQIHQESGV